jgi:hypothetical protein
MTRLRVVQAGPGSLGAGTVVTPGELLPAGGIVAIDVSQGVVSAAEVIGFISHRIALGTAPDEVIFVSADAHHLEQYRVYIS